MESDDEDIFAISDEEMSPPTRTAQMNPVEEHLQKQLADVKNRIDVAVNEIAEIKATTAHVLNALEWRALHGEDASSDSDSELYTVEGVPVIKKQRRIKTEAETILKLVSRWKCVFQDKWIIGVELQNTSFCGDEVKIAIPDCVKTSAADFFDQTSAAIQYLLNLESNGLKTRLDTLLNPRYYPYVLSTRGEEIFGESTFWKLKEERFFHSEKINSIQPGPIVATMVLDLPIFDQEPVVKCWSIISYEIDETQFQIPVPPIQLSIAETIDSSCVKFLDNNKYGAILALKSTSTIEKIVKVQFSRDDPDDQDDQNGSGNELFRFLTRKMFAKICNNVFLMKEHGSLMYCLVEIRSIDVDEANISIFARSVNQLNIILHLLQDEFPNVSVVEETDDCVEAANALIHELKMFRDKKSIYEIQEAKVITDLLIP